MLFSPPGHYRERTPFGLTGEPAYREYGAQYPRYRYTGSEASCTLARTAAGRFAVLSCSNLVGRAAYLGCQTRGLMTAGHHLYALSWMIPLVIYLC